MSNLANLDPSTLDNVTGGTSPSATSHSSSASNAALTSQLSGLQDSIKSLATQPQQQSAFSNPTTALMFAMALSQRQQAPTVVTAGAPGVVYVGGGHRHWW